MDIINKTRINPQPIKEQTPTAQKKEELDLMPLWLEEIKFSNISALTGDNNGGESQTNMVCQMMMTKGINNVNEGINNITEILNDLTTLLKSHSEFSDEKNNKSITV